MRRLRDGTFSLWAMIAICVFLCFVFTLGILSTRAYDRAAKDHQTSQAYTETQRAFADRCRGLEGQEIFNCLEDQIEAAREPGRAEEDVQAQKEMARWALWMLIVTGAVGLTTTAVTFVGVLYVRDTLFESRRIGRAETRAYLSIEGGRYEITQGYCTITLDVKNYGSSPALAVFVTPTIETNRIRVTSKIIPETSIFTAQRFTFGPMQAGYDGPLALEFDRQSSAADSGEWDKVLDDMECGRFFKLSLLVEWLDVFDEAINFRFRLIGTYSDARFDDETEMRTDFGTLAIDGRST